MFRRQKRSGMCSPEGAKEFNPGRKPWVGQEKRGESRRDGRKLPGSFGAKNGPQDDKGLTESWRLKADSSSLSQKLGAKS